MVSGNMNKTIRRITDRRQQQIETYRYWQSLPPGERLSAVCDASTDAYGFKERDSMMQKGLKELLLALNEQGVEYLVVGGY